MTDKLKVLDLFSGIGGFSLGLERSGGFETVAFCEIEKFPQAVLRKHWPGVPIYDDITTLEFSKPVDLVTAGFPCQDISYAGQGAGLSGERSGLFWHVLRTALLVGQPKLLLENVAALLNRGLCSVLGALASLGYDTEWHCIPASAVGAPQLRDRVWIIADVSEKWPEPRIQGLQAPKPARQFGGGFGRSGVRGADKSRICGDAYGVSGWLDRHFSLGNTVYPKIPELIGRAILESEAE